METDGQLVIGFISLAGDDVAALFVDPDAQGHGIGNALLSQVKSLRDKLSLSVYAQNERALGFCRHHGFEVIEERVNEDTGKPEALMSWGATPSNKRSDTDKPRP